MIISSPASGFSLPLSFPSFFSPQNPEDVSSGVTSNSLLDSFRKSKPTSLKAWVRTIDGEEQPHKGLVVGCEDGSLYVFHEKLLPATSNVPEPPPETFQPSSLKAPTKHNRSTSPPIGSAPLLITPRVGVVSGVSIEQAEAPKNYVDFEDEPDKLKDLLKGKNPSVKTLSDTASERAVSVKSPTPPTITLTEKHPPRRREMSKVLINMPSNITRPFSTPSSPREPASPEVDLSDDLELQYHIIPRINGQGNSVRSISVLADSFICIVLQESGFLYLFSLADGQCLTCVQTKDGLLKEQMAPKDRDVLYETYVWRSLQISAAQQSTYIIASAFNHGGTPSGSSDVEDTPQERTFSVLYQLESGSEARPTQHTLEFLGSWELDCVANSVNILTNPDGRDLIFCINTGGKISARNLKVLPDLPTSPSPEPDSNSTHLNIPNPFKLKSRSSEHLSLHENKIRLKVFLDEPQTLGELVFDSPLCGFFLCPGQQDLFGIIWNETELIITECADSFQVLHRSAVEDIVDVRWLDDHQYAVLFEDRADIYKLERVDANNDAIQEPSPPKARWYPNFSRTITIDRWNTACFSSPTEFINIVDDSMGGRHICAYTWGDESEITGVVSRTLLSIPMPVSSGVTSTSLLPLDVGLILVGSSDGFLRLMSLDQLCQGRNDSSSPLRISDKPLDGYICGLQVVPNFRTGERYILGGADDGSIAVWNINNFELCARWIVFNTTLRKAVQFPEEKGSPLHGCVLCVAQDGAIAVVAVDGFQFLYLIPGASSNLESICVGGHNLLLIYADRRCRLWDVQTKEFWRSMGVEKADEMLEQGGWKRIDLDDKPQASTVWDVPAPLPTSPDAVSILSLQAERFIADSITATKAISTSLDQTRAILKSLDQLRSVLSALVTPGLNSDIDLICRDKLGIRRSNVVVGLVMSDSVSLYNTKSSDEVWCISGNVTATRLLGIVLAFRVVALFEEYTEAANGVISFYTTSLSGCIGEAYKPPSLSYLASLWFQGSNELRQAIRTVFDATISSMSDEEAISTLEHWQHYVPCLQLPSERESLTAALSLFVCGFIAAEKYSFMSAPVLRDISKSISLYLLDEKSSYRVLAIDLCSRGFNVWQHYIDSMEILRSLFMLATTSRKNDISTQNVGAQARAAVLFIATKNTPLFMSTLGLDILTPPTLEHRRSVLQIVAFLIRKRPSVLQPNLPRLMEAVVKSLDPNNTTNREAVLDTATEIIGYVVKTFPTVDFHMSTQRLAVGTNEGAVIMYDLKTAIRLFVLEGHKKPITAVSFSPDGRRLVTLSMEESVALVWKVGASFISFFTPGAPPRQGNSGGQPFKTFPFNLGTEGMSLYY
ncbi:hypothetical protein NP233_g816 [Leucocoprinus birnbaumii]|uniref:WD40 repeat-like protein n=1 Tax=Leucocoprinus birnbaumii TaxID=56174 RepID=A0AAD5W1N5_9AGAR|nr:hypothetical protein NP233_g816 [Leucocoprinus birnbaumii]